MDLAVKRRLWFWLPLAAVLGVVLIWLFYPRAIAVDVVAAKQAPLRVIISDEGETRVRDLFVVSAPITGFMRRIDLEPGDKVTAGNTVIARIDPAEPGLLDARTLASNRAAAEAADFARKAAQAELQRAQAEFDYAQTEWRRAQGLAEDNAIAQSAFDAAQRQASAATAQLQQAQASLKMHEAEYQRAQAQLMTPRRNGTGKTNSKDTVLVHAPVDGEILRVVARSESFVTSGTPLVELGNARELEVQVDLLSADAVKVKPGQEVLIDAWGGSQPLHGVVHDVEPFGFTKVSALGIEEQRVRVVIDFTDPYERWRQLGHGYRVEPKIVVWQSSKVLQVPLSSLFRDGNDWAVFVIRKGRVELRHVTIDHQNGLAAEVTHGLQPGESLVAYPDDRITPGTRVAQRQ